MKKMTEADKKLSKVLYELDPAETSCKENEADDEYDYLAMNINSDITEYDVSFSRAFYACYEEAFSESPSDEVINAVEAAFNS